MYCFLTDVLQASFSAFNTEELALFERQVVMQAGARMSPLCTPSSFVPFILRHCREVGDVGLLSELAIGIIGDFLEDPLSMVFAPSTVAVSAVIVSLSVMHLSADALLATLPQFLLLASPGQPFFQPDQGKHR